MSGKESSGGERVASLRPFSVQPSIWARMVNQDTVGTANRYDGWPWAIEGVCGAGKLTFISVA